MVIVEGGDEEGDEEFREDIKTAICHVRQDVKKFRRSPKSNEMLQLNVQASFQKELKLILDVKTRWNSLHDMFERYCLLRSCIVKTMIDIKSTSAVTDNEFAVCKSLCEALKPFKAATKGICRNDANLVTADAAIVFLLNELKDQSSLYALQLHDTVKARIIERRQPVAVALLKYLINPDSINKADPITGTKVSKQSVITTANTLSHRLLISNPDSPNHEAHQDTPLSTEKPLSMEEKLEEAMAATVAEQPVRELPKSLAQDFKMFEATTKRTEYLDNLFHALMTAKPTSVESERTFSVG